jgi:hypothetical protein
MAKLLHANPYRAAVIDSMVGVLTAAGVRGSYLVPGDTTQVPKLHLKANLFVDGRSWDMLMQRAEWADVIREYIAYLAGAPSRWRQPDLAAPDALDEAARHLARGLLEDLRRADGEHVISYFTVGSTNMNYRSMVMDGEVQVTVSGWEVLPGLTDFLLLMSLSEWPETQAELDELLPPPGGTTRAMANLIRLML